MGAVERVPDLRCARGASIRVERVDELSLEEPL